MNLENCPKLDFKITVPSSYHRSRFAAAFRYAASAGTKTLAKVKRQLWLDGLANSKGPLKLDLSLLPLGGLDFSNLAKNESIRFLDLTDSDVDENQLMHLRGMRGLEVLYSGTRHFADPESTLQELTAALPNLRRFCPVPPRVKITDHAKLESICELDPTFPSTVSPAILMLGGQFGSIYLENLPMLEDTITMNPDAELCHLVNLDRLRGLIFYGAPPKVIKLQNLPQMEVFAGGGGKLTEDAIRTVLQSSSLSNLTLAHVSLSQETVSRIGKQKRLAYLCLCGADFDEPDLSTWNELTRIQYLRLDQTNLPPNAISSLGNLSNLHELWVPSLDAAGFRSLTRFPKLEFLQVDQCDLNIQAVQDLGKVKQLNELVLRDCEIDEAILQSMAKELGDRFFALRFISCEIDGLALEGFALLRDEIHFELLNCTLDEDSSAELTAMGRILNDPCATAMFGAGITAIGGKTGRVDPRKYAPGAKPLLPQVPSSPLRN
ncbi:MAG: hypothetical protein AAF483_05365 [Planctomycetota bacterium]